MRSALQLIAGVAVAGVVAAGSTAFTATGLTTSAPASTFLGGKVTQTITGGSANLDTIAYTFSNDSHTAVTAVELTFATTMTGRTVAATIQNGGAVVMTCPAFLTPFLAVTCTVAATTGMTSLDVVVS